MPNIPSNFESVKIHKVVAQRLKEVKEETGVPFSKQIELAHSSYYPKPKTKVNDKYKTK